jgi:hypothetical protein
MAALLESRQERGLPAIAFVKGEPAELQAILGGAVDEFDSDLRLGAIGHAVRNPGFATTNRVIGPAFGEIKLTFQKRMKVAVGHAEVHGDGAVVGLAGSPAVLALNARSFVPFFHIGGLIDDSDRGATAMGTADALVELREHEILIPAVQRKKLLKGPRMCARRKRDRLNRLSRQRTQLTFDVGSDVPPGGSDRAVIEVLEETTKCWTQRQKFFSLHNPSLSKCLPHKEFRHLMGADLRVF